MNALISPTAKRPGKLLAAALLTVGALAGNILNSYALAAADDRTAADSKSATEPAGTITAIIDGKTVYLPSLKSDITAQVDGDLATVTIVQSFTNPYDQPMNASYLFPMNKDGAVYEMQMQIGSERVRAKIAKKRVAERQFEVAKSQGKSAALLQQQRPNMFTQKIANLMPGLPIQVTMRYVHPVQRIDGAYQLVLPLVVGPRYQPAGMDSNENPSAQPINSSGNSEAEHHFEEAAAELPAKTNTGAWQIDRLAAYPPTMGIDLPAEIDADRVAINVRINGGMVIQQIRSDSHSLNVQQPTPNSATVALAAGRTIDNRDFILRYQLTGEATQAGLLSHVDERGGFLSLLIEPPAIPAEDDITPREMVFVLDCSGSMNGAPMDASKAFMRTALQALRPDDTFRIIRFSDSATEFSRQPLAATPNNIRRGLKYAARLNGYGGTEMTSGIRQAFAPTEADGRIRIVTFLTDGYIGNERNVLKLLREQRGEARLYALGVGSSVNRYLLDEMGRVGRGFTRYIDPTEEPEAVATALAQRLQSPLLTDISIDWGELRASEQFPAAVPDLFAGDSLRIQAKFPGEQLGRFKITINGLVHGRKAQLPVMLDVQKTSSGNGVALTWARSNIRDAMQARSTPLEYRQPPRSDDEIQQQITQLGLDYSLVTNWTSFIAVSEHVYNSNPAANGEGQVALPQVAGVNRSAYPRQAGGAAPAAGPIVTLLIMCFGLFAGWRRKVVAAQ